MAVGESTKWRFVITALDGSIPSGAGIVFQAKQRTYGHHLNTAKTGTLTIEIDNPRANYIMANPKTLLVKVYRTDRLGVRRLLTVADVLTVEEDGGSGQPGTITLGYSDPWWRMGGRLLGLNIDDQGQGSGLAYDASVGNLGAVLLNLLSNINSGSTVNAFTGVINGTIADPTSSIPTLPFGPVYSEKFIDAAQQIMATLGGPDVELVPNEPIPYLGDSAAILAGANPTQIATMNIYAHLGVITPVISFDYGCGNKTMLNYKRVLDKTNYANLTFTLPQGWPKAVAQLGLFDILTPTPDAPEIISQGERDYIAESDVAALLLRQAAAAEALAVLKGMRQQVTFNPIPDCPLDYMVDFNIGDVINCNIFDEITKTYRLRGSARLYGVDFVIDDNDSETATFTLIPGTT